MPLNTIDLSQRIFLSVAEVALLLFQFAFKMRLMALVMLNGETC